MSNEFGAREFFNYLAGSYIIAAILNIGFGLIVDAPWKMVLGGTLMLGLILFAVTLDCDKKKRDKAEREKPATQSAVSAGEAD